MCVSEWVWVCVAPWFPTTHSSFIMYIANGCPLSLLTSPVPTSGAYADIYSACLCARN